MLLKMEEPYLVGLVCLNPNLKSINKFRQNTDFDTYPMKYLEF